MEFSQIRYFLEVAQTQHITHSAEKLHIAQPALSQAIHRLEKDLGVPLFVSRGRNIILTEYGIYLKEKLEPLMERFDAIPDELQRMAKLESETIHMNVLAASTLVTEAVIAYKTLHKNINFQIFQNTESELYDIEVTTKMFYNTSEGLQNSEFVCTEKIFLAVPDNEKYDGLSSIKLEAVKKEGFISLLGSKQLRWICDKFCQHVGFQPKVVFESDNPTAVKNMIAANTGIGFWPEFTWGRLWGSNVKLLEISDPVCTRDILFTYKKNKTDSKNVEDFFTFLQEYTRRASKRG